MTRRETIALALLPTWALLFILAALGLADPRRLDPREFFADPNEDPAAEWRLYQTVKRGFVQHSIHEARSDLLLYEALKGLGRAYDRYWRFHPPAEQEAFHRRIYKEFAGLGIQIRPHEREPYLEIVTPLPDSPALAAGVESGDLLLGFWEGDRYFSGKGRDLEWAQLNLKGEQGSEVTLHLARWDAARGGYDEGRRLRVARAQVESKTVLDADVLDPARGLGLLWVTDFGAPTGEELRRAVLDLKQQGLRGLVLDLRDNPGGMLEVAVAMANAFLKDGVIVRQRGRAPEEERVHVAEPGRAYAADLPLVVLINGESASASEVLAGALQDHRRALVVGARSYGKFSVQTPQEATLHTAAGTQTVNFLMTTAFYLTPAGRRGEQGLDPERGLRPDVLVPMDEAAMDAVREFRRRRQIIPSAATRARAAPPVRPEDPVLAAALDLLYHRKAYDQPGR